MQSNILDLIMALSITAIGIGALMSCYALISAGIWIWERITGNALEDKFKDCLPWLNDKES